MSLNQVSLSDFRGLDDELRERIATARLCGFSSPRSYLRSSLFHGTDKTARKRCILNSHLYTAAYCYGSIHEALLTIDPNTEKSLADIVATFACNASSDTYLKECHKCRILCCVLLRAMRVTSVIPELESFLRKPIRERPPHSAGALTRDTTPDRRRIYEMEIRNLISETCEFLKNI